MKVSKEDKTTFLLFFSLNPLVLNYAIGINPDFGVSVFSYFLLYLAIKFKKKINFPKVILLGFIAGCSYLAKTTGLMNLVFVGFFLFFKRKNFFDFLKKYVIFFCLF